MPRAFTASASSAPFRPSRRFLPLMTLYLTDNTSPAEIARAKASGFVHAIKYYPAGATTNADSGVTALQRVYPALEAMQAHGVVLSLHGEATGPDVDIFDRERVFVERSLTTIVRDFPGLKIVLEHITTEEAAAFVAAAGPGVAATITPQHLLYSRNALFAGGIRPHLYCLPILKRERHRRALVAAATGGNPKFFLGTDSAPHAKATKENACGCAGCYTAPVALALYAEAFEAAGALDRLEGFASHHGADFYGLPRNGDKVTLAARTVDRAGRIPVRRGWGRAAARGRDRVLARSGAGTGRQTPDAPHVRRRIGRRQLERKCPDPIRRTPRRGILRRGCYPSASEASQTVAARNIGGRKVRAPQSRMPGNARPR